MPFTKESASDHGRKGGKGRGEGKGKGKGKEAAEARRASARHALDARIGGSVAEVKPSPDDLAARAEADWAQAKADNLLNQLRVCACQHWHQH